ncbi:hypothetical protein NW766_008706 [Fusarium irregulare]|uniref:Heterokaryon incompatibility domain-containing protein n=1 Tax=Fusarium irregulare TaxID=2494466 RepID=A0A9W8U826_9HYPO|nr:hypothetical protein NW766_008706 [Fusarium irregulare]
MSTYRYTQLPAGCIRILRLQPHQDKRSAIRCQLSDLELRSSEGLCPYEALSYVWGSPDKPHTIDVEGYSLSVGANLYAALLSLRYTSLERILWVDAACIDQTNITEKEQQIQLMAEIYAKARSVIIWLGEATTAGAEDALEDIRVAAASTSNGVEINIPGEEPILEILKLPWFKRVWASSKSAEVGDIVCLFDGCSRPTIIRLCGMNWIIIFISITPAIKPAELPPLYHDRWDWQDLLGSLGKPSAKFELIWDLDMQRDQKNLPSSNVATMSPTTTNSIQRCMKAFEREETYVWLRHSEKKSLSEIERRLREIIKKLDIVTVIDKLNHPLSSVYLKESMHALQSILMEWQAFKATQEDQDPMLKNGLEIDHIVDTLLGIYGGWLPLKWAIDDGLEAVARLMLHFADPNAGIEYDLTPLAWASSHGYDSLVKLLLDTAKVAPDTQNKRGETPLLLAAKWGYDTVVEKLLDTGKVDPDAEDDSGDTPLLVAVFSNHVAVVKLLLETGE